MKSQKSVYYVLGVMMLAFVIWSLYSKKNTRTHVESPVSQAPGLAILPDQAEEGTEPTKQEVQQMQELQKTVLKQREQYKSHLALGAMPATPKISDGQYTFKLGYEPINLGCREGDIDIIQESLPDKQSVLLTLDTEDEKPVLTRTLTIEELKKAFEAQIKIPAASPGKVYRLTLCTDTNKVGDCRRATPAAMDFAARKKNANKNQHHIFYAQTFMTDTNGLQIFDSRRQDLEQKDVDAMQIAGKKKESSYLKQLAAINATVKPLPAVFQDNTFKMKLTFRDMKACEGLGGGK